MVVTEAYPIFAFERDFAGDLRCIPMIARFKLDQCGIKLSLRQWSRFDHAERDELARGACTNPAEIAAYRDRLARLIEVRAGETPVSLPPVDDSEWNDPAALPERIADRARLLGLPTPDRACWADLSPLQRFALFKLTRPGHDNDNFEPALREFGLIPAEAG